MLAASHRADLLDLGDLARAVVLPQPAEAPQLALEVAGRLAEPLEPDRRPIHRVELDQRVDQLVGDPGALLGRVERGGIASVITSPCDPLHHVERRADHGRVVAHRQHLRHPDRRGLERAQQPRLAQHVVRARRQRPARRAAQHDPGGQHEGDVRVALADRASRVRSSGASSPGAARNSRQRRRARAAARARWRPPRRGCARCRRVRATVIRWQSRRSDLSAQLPSN